MVYNLNLNPIENKTSNIIWKKLKIFSRYQGPKN